MRSHLVLLKDIDSPRLCVAPPFWIMCGVWVVLSSILLIVIEAHIDISLLKFVLGIGVVVVVGVFVKTQRTNATTLVANKDGLFFSTLPVGKYHFIPWANIGFIEEADFPVNERGIRVEITGEHAVLAKSGDLYGNVRHESGKIFIYTLPQLRSRKKLIQDIVEYKGNV